MDMVIDLKKAVYAPPELVKFGGICSLSVFIFNLIYYFIFSALVVLTVYKIAMAIKHISMSDSSETMEKLRENITDIIFSIVGLLVISSALFFPKVILSTMGVVDGKNPFVDFGGCSSGSIP